MISSEQSGRRADGRSVALAIVAAAPVAVVAVFAAGLFVLYQNLLDLDRAMGELEVQMDGIEQHLGAVEAGQDEISQRLARLEAGMELLLRHFDLVPPAGPQR